MPDAPRFRVKASYSLTSEDKPASSQRDHHKTGVNDERPGPPRGCLLQGEVACQFIYAERSEARRWAARRRRLRRQERLFRCRRPGLRTAPKCCLRGSGALFSPPRSTDHREFGGSVPSATSSTGTRLIRAATSPRGNCRRSSVRTCLLPSGRCVIRRVSDAKRLTPITKGLR